MSKVDVNKKRKPLTLSVKNNIDKLAETLGKFIENN